MATKRDWGKQPPTTLEEAFQFAENLAESACAEIERALGERPRHERRDSSVVIIWPDGEVTNEIEVFYVQ